MITNIISNTIGQVRSIQIVQSISNLELYYRPTFLSFDGSNKVDTWTDQSPNGNNATQATQIDKPEYIPNAVNGEPVLRFDASQFFTIGSLVSLTGEFSVIIVLSTKDKTQGDFWIGNSGSGKKWGNNASNIFVRVVASSDNTIAYPFADDAYGILTLTRDSSDKIDLYINNGSANRLFADAAQSGTFDFDQIARTDTGQEWDGDIAEVIVYSRELTATERASIIRLLTNRYL